MKGNPDRATIQGTARVIDDDPHSDWERLILDLWQAKEPAINDFLKARVALPLFFERAVIEITPERCLYWAGRPDRCAPPRTSAPRTRWPRDDDRHRPTPRASRSGSVPAHAPAAADLERLATYPFVVVSWIDDAGYPTSASPPTSRPIAAAGTVRLGRPGRRRRSRPIAR